MPAYGSGNIVYSRLSGTMKLSSAFTSTVNASYVVGAIVAASSDYAPDAYGCDDGADKHYRFSGFTSTIKASFIASNNNLGITWDGGDGSTIGTLRYYTADNTNTKIKKFSGFTSTVAASITFDSAWDITYDENDLYAMDFGDDRARHLSAFTTTVKESIATPGLDPRGLSIQGVNLISSNVSANPNDKIYLHSAFSTTIKQSIDTVTNDVHGLEWDAFAARTDFVAAPVAAAVSANHFLLMGV